MQFETVTPADLAEIRNLQPEGWQDITLDFNFYIRSPFCYPIKAMSDKRMVGIGASIVFENTAWLAHIIVNSNFRNQGIGGEIVKSLMSDLEKKNIKTCLLIATEQGKPVYLRQGFEEITEYVFLKKEIPWKEISQSDRIVHFKEAYRSFIYKMDKDISGENRKRLIDAHLDGSRLYMDGKEPSGFYLPGLGEGLVYAETQESGLELMRLKYLGADKAVLPANNIAGLEFLRKNGFTVTDKKGTRMTLGEKIDWQPEKIYSRIAGKLG